MKDLKDTRWYCTMVRNVLHQILFYWRWDDSNQPIYNQWSMLHTETCRLTHFWPIWGYKIEKLAKNGLDFTAMVCFNWQLVHISLVFTRSINLTRNDLPLKHRKYSFSDTCAHSNASVCIWCINSNVGSFGFTSSKYIYIWHMRNNFLIF